MCRLIFVLFILLATPSMAQEQIAWMGSSSVGGSGDSTVTCGAAYLEDTFDRGDSATIGGSWSETDTGGLLSISSNTLLLTHSATTAAYGSWDHTSTVNDYWVQFTVNLNENATLGATKSITVIAFRDAANQNANIGINTNSSQNIYQLQASYRNDANSLVAAGTYAWSPSTGTAYTIKAHFKGGASSTGEVHVYVDGTERITVTGLAYDTYAPVRYVRFGNVISSITSTTLTINYDNFEWRSDDCF